MKTALVVCSAPVEGTEAVVRGLAPGVDLTVGVDGGAGVCLRAGVVPHLVIGDFDSLDPARIEELDDLGIPREIAPQDKDVTDLDLAMEALSRRGIEEVTVTAAFSGRLDHTLAALGSVARAASMRPRIVEPHMSAWLLEPRSRPTHLVEKIPGPVSLIALAGPAVVSCRGVRWPLDRERLEPLSSWGVSNEVIAEQAVFIAHSGSVLLTVERAAYSEESASRG